MFCQQRSVLDGAGMLGFIDWRIIETLNLIHFIFPKLQLPTSVLAVKSVRDPLIWSKIPLHLLLCITEQTDDVVTLRNWSVTCSAFSYTAN